MNLPSYFKTLTTKQYQLTAKQRLIVIGAIGVMALFITFYVTTSEVAIEPTMNINNGQQAANIPPKSVIPGRNQLIPVNQVEQTMRDPFAKLPEVKEINNQSDYVAPPIKNNIPSFIPNYVPAMVPKQIVPSIPHEKLRLTGIVGNAERRLAVIMSANKSQSYSVNDVIDSYKIVAIDDDSVILTNGAGQLVLRLESSGQKGG